jgi:hypothetical protein
MGHKYQPTTQPTTPPPSLHTHAHGSPSRRQTREHGNTAIPYFYAFHGWCECVRFATTHDSNGDGGMEEERERLLRVFARERLRRVRLASLQTVATRAEYERARRAPDLSMAEYERARRASAATGEFGRLLVYLAIGRLLISEKARKDFEAFLNDIQEAYGYSSELDAEGRPKLGKREEVELKRQR